MPDRKLEHAIEDSPRGLCQPRRGLGQRAQEAVDARDSDLHQQVPTERGKHVVIQAVPISFDSLLSARFSQVGIGQPDLRQGIHRRVLSYGVAG